MYAQFSFDDASAGRLDSDIIGMAMGGIQLIISRVEGYLVHVTIEQIGQGIRLQRSELEARARAVFDPLPYEAIITVLPNDQEILDKSLN